MTIELIIKANENTTDDEIETAAAKALLALACPCWPIADVVNMAEARGVLTAAVGAFEVNMNSFTIRTNKRPVVVLCTSKGVVARRRFDMAHELGHLVLHKDRAGDPRRLETQAQGSRPRCSCRLTKYAHTCLEILAT